MSTSIHAINKEGRIEVVSINDYPDQCPICHNFITPVVQYSQAYYNKLNWTENDCLQIPLRCPRVNCQKLFIANYKPYSSTADSFLLKSCQPITETKREFSDVIEDISKNFCEIYNQSLAAEENNLLEICGVGYRKSLEFLIKDYLIKLDTTKEEEIKGKFLGKCISENIENENIKNVAKRATWLGNDETHYLRKWEGKDLEDLKKLIDLVLHWMEMEALTEEVIKDMPEEIKTTSSTETH